MNKPESTMAQQVAQAVMASLRRLTHIHLPQLFRVPVALE